MSAEVPQGQQGSLGERREVKIGVLAIQGDFAEHVAMFERERDARKAAGVVLVVEEVRKPEQLEGGLDGLVIPGGESTTLSVFLRQNGFEEKLRRFASDEGGKRRPVCVWGTCAGLILLSEQLDSQKQGGQVTLGGIDIQCTRNAYGRQMQSFEGTIKLQEPALFQDDPDSHLARDEFHGIFIRAPGIVKINSPSTVRVLATLATGGNVVAVRQGRLMATAFHPELSRNTRWHAYFIDMVLANTFPPTTSN